MFARNAVGLHAFDVRSTASSRAIASSALERLRSVTSWQRQTRHWRPPSTRSSLVISMSMIVPSLSWWRYHGWLRCRPRSPPGGVRAATAASALGVIGGRQRVDRHREELLAAVAVAERRRVADGHDPPRRLLVDHQRLRIALEQEPVLGAGRAQLAPRVRNRRAERNPWCAATALV